MLYFNRDVFQLKIFFITVLKFRGHHCMESRDWGWGLFMSVSTNMADQVKLLPYLPVEVVVQILCCEEVSHVDICRLSLTCQRMREICYTEEIWRCKYRQRCVHFFDYQTNSWTTVVPAKSRNQRRKTVIFIYFHTTNG